MSVENIELSKIFVSFLRTKMTTVGGGGKSGFWDCRSLKIKPEEKITIRFGFENSVVAQISHLEMTFNENKNK